MSPNEDQSAQNRGQRVLLLTLVAVSGQVGCITLIIIIAALSLGLWLDGLFESQPVFTIILMIVSIPVTLVTMIWVVRRTTAYMVSKRIQTMPKEDAELERKT